MEQPAPGEATTHKGFIIAHRPCSCCKPEKRKVHFYIYTMDGKLVAAANTWDGVKNMKRFQ